MKKLAVLLLVGAMTLGTVACGTTGDDGGKNTQQGSESVNQDTQQESEDVNENTQQTSDAISTEITEANDILANAWKEYNAKAGDEMKFSIAGGNVESMIMDVPAKFDVTLEGAEDALVSSYCIPTDAIAMTDDVATMTHMMNANTFSSAAYHVTEAANVQTVIDNIKNATLNNQWMCGFPETLIIVTVGDDYVVSAFGNAQLIDTFKTAITNVYGDMANVVVEEALAR